ncbi:universal stress protein [Marinovum sp.]|uniref:universal stress protein n=1 Tax=Marinovum sp. TaxID=2024839 RepID=UPI003A92C11F
MTIKKIMIASDLSERSDRALRRGLTLAAELDSEVTLVSVVDDAFPAHIAEDLLTKCRNHLASVATYGEGRSCDVQVEIGDPTQRLVEMVTDGRFDLVVVGRHRHRGLLDQWRPTTVERVVAHALTPVLLVVTPGEGPYQRVLAPVAFSRACRRSVDTAFEIAPDAEFHLFYAWMAPFEGLTGGRHSDMARAVERETRNLSAAWSALGTADLPPVELVHGGVRNALDGQSRKWSPDLIAVGAHARSLSFTGLGSFAAEMVRDPGVDLLIAGATEAAGD